LNLHRKKKRKPRTKMSDTKEPLIKKGDEADYSEGKDELSGEIVLPSEEREYTDCLFIFIFWAFFLGAFVIAGIATQYINYDLLTDIKDCYDSVGYLSLRETHTYNIMGTGATVELNTDNTDFVVLGQSVNLFVMMALLAMYLGFFWLTVLTCCVAVIIYVAVYFIPVALIAVGGFGAYYFYGQTTYLIGGVILAIGGIVGIFLVRCLFQERIEATIDLFENAGDYMEDSPMMFACSFGNIIFKFLMLVVFLGLIGLGFVSYEVKPNDTNQECIWTKAKYLDYYVWYQVVAMIWTVSLITNLNIGTVAGSAGLWYFGDESERSNAKDNRTCTALKWCFTKSFGSLALGALVSTFIILLQTYLIYLRETFFRAEDDDTTPTRIYKCIVRSVINCLLAILQCILRFITYFATIYLVTRGESFCQGAKKCFNLLKRNGLSAMVVDAFTSWFVFLTTQAVALLLGFITLYMLHTYRKASDLACGLGFLISFIIGNIIFGIFTDIVMAVVDAMYVFVAIDEDSGRASTHKSADKMRELNSKKRQ